MAETALAVRSNLSHNVLAAVTAAKTHLTDLANLYLITEVAGQSQATLDAKRRDLHRFLAFYHQLYGHDRPEEWFVSVTKAFLKHLRGARFAQASLVRIYATVRHFARWLDRKFPGLFPLGCPTDGGQATGGAHGRLERPHPPGGASPAQRCPDAARAARPRHQARPAQPCGAGRAARLRPPHFRSAEPGP